MVKMQAQKIVMVPAAKLSSLNTKVARAERKVEELEKELDGKELVCGVSEKVGPAKPYSTAVAKVPDGYTRTGGGCSSGPATTIQCGWRADPRVMADASARLVPLPGFRFPSPSRRS